MVVRVNRPWRLLVRDLEAAVIPGVAALMLTKVDSPEHVLACAEIVAELEAERGLPAGVLKFIALVENAAGFFRIEQIAKAHPSRRRAQPGVGGFRAPMSACSRSRKGCSTPSSRRSSPRGRPASCRMGFVGSIADFRDQDAFRAIVRRSRQLGFMCASAVHPLQVSVLNEEFSPDPAEVERAERMIAAYDDAYAKGLGAVQFEGAMIDVPVVERARSVVRRAAALRRRVTT